MYVLYKQDSSTSSAHRNRIEVFDKNNPYINFINIKV